MYFTFNKTLLILRANQILWPRQTNGQENIDMLNKGMQEAVKCKRRIWVSTDMVIMFKSGSQEMLSSLPFH